MKFLKITTLLLMLAGVWQAQAQSAAEFKKIAQKNEGEDVIDFFKSDKVSIDVVDGKPDISTHHIISSYYLTDRAQDFSEKNIFYSGTFNTVKNIEAWSMIPRGKGFSRMDVTGYKEKHPMNDGIFYDDNLVINFYFPGLQANSVSNLTYDEKINDEHFLDGFFFSTYRNTHQSQYSIEYPTDKISIKYVLLNDDGSIQFEQKTKKGKTILQWTTSNLKKIPYEPGSPDVRYYAPHIIPYIEKYYNGHEWVEVFSDVNHLHKWYYTFIKTITEEAMKDALLKKLSDSITQYSTTEYQKAKSIFYWVENNIKYIAFEDGLGGFIPRSPASVCSKRYGDCKDMANLLTTLLKLAGIKAYPAWIGTRSIPYSYYKVPTAAVDNHMISVAEIDGKKYFLDATGSYLNFNFPSCMIQGKEALVSKGEKGFEIMKIPEIPMQESGVYDTCVAEIKDNILYVDATAKYRGMMKYDWVCALQRQTEKKREEVFMEEFHLGNNKSEITNFKLTGFNHPDSTGTTYYTNKIKNYIIKTGDEVYVNMILRKDLINYIDTTQKKLGIERNYKSDFIKSILLKIPEGYTPQKLPPNSSYSTEKFGYSISYSKAGKDILCKIIINENCLQIHPEDFTEYNKMVSHYFDACSQVVTLKKKI